MQNIQIKKRYRKYHWNRAIRPCVIDYIVEEMVYLGLFIGSIIASLMLTKQGAGLLIIIPLFIGCMSLPMMGRLIHKIVVNWGDFELLRKQQTEQDINDQKDQLISWYESTHHCSYMSKQSNATRYFFKNLHENKIYTIRLAEIWDEYWIEEKE